MKSTIWKRFGSILLVLTMVFSIIPDTGVTVKAQPRGNETTQVQENTEGTYPISVTTAEGYSYAEVEIEGGKRKRVNRAAPGETIYLNFSDYNISSRTGFVRWTDDNGNLTDLTNATSYYGCSFTMPEGEVKVHAELAKNCPTVTVENGRIMVSGGKDFYILNSSSVTAGREIYLYFDESKTPENKTFKKWYVKSGNVELSDPTSKHHCMFTVPNEDVEIGVIYESTEGTYPISVTTAEGSSYAEVIKEDGTRKIVNRALPGEKIYLSFFDYNTSPGTGFVRWVDDNGNLTDLTNETSYRGCSFTMPEGEVEIHAELAKNCPTVTVENGGIKVPIENGHYILSSSSVTAGREIYLYFDESKTPENKVFKKWYVKSGNVELSDPTSKYDCMFTVPNENVEIGVIYGYPISVTTSEGSSYAEVINEDGITERVNSAVPGEKIYLEFSDYNMTSGTGFVRWVDDNGNLTDLTNETSYHECSFTMPEGEVKIHAELAKNCPTVTVENGGIKVSEGENFNILNSSSVVAGREIYLYFEQSKTPKNKVFKKWYVKSENVELSDPTSMNNCMLTVPNEDVEIGVIYDDAYAVSVENGYAQYELPNGEYVWSTSTAAPGTQMYLKINPYTKPKGMAFSKWIVKKGNVQLDSPYSSYLCPYIMPSEDIEIAAEFVPGHAFSVEGGSTCKTIPDNQFDWYIDVAAPGDQVWAYYEEDMAPEGMEFARWEVTKGNVQLDEPEDKVCSFIMPDEDVIVSAIYKPVGSMAESGWQSDSVGWWYNDENGNYVTGWKSIDGEWYYFASNGYMQTGWKSIDGEWYYFASNGYMQTGWNWIDGSCYYFYEDGHMASDTWIDGSYVNGSGAWVEHPVLSGWQSDNVGWWYNDENGNYVTGWKSINGEWYYFASNGYMQTGWKWIEGSCYYFYEDGHMASDTWIDGSYVNGSGVWVE